MAPPEGAVPARKEPRQRRSRQLVAAILQAAAETFAELGYARATTNVIAARAGVSVGSLYQYFPNKDSLLARLREQHVDHVHAVVGAGLAALADPRTPLEQGLRQIIGDLVAVHEANPVLTRALSAAVLRESPAAQEAEREADAVAASVSALLAARPDVRRGDHLVMAALLGQTMAQLSPWLVHDAPPALDRATLFEETVQLLLRYLRR
ncbi:MAG TPA: TetR/AcrR family transcriptional regulator [Polyangia bacterium]